MLKLVPKAMEEILKEGNTVKFVGNFTDSVRDGDCFTIERTVQVTYEISVILPPADSTMIDLNQLGLYPESEKTLYEILVGLKGGKEMLIYPQIPAGKYIWRLEKSTIVPNVASEELRYLGEISVDDSPYTDPRLRIHTIKDLEPLVFIVYNDASDYEKIVLKFIVNKCRIKRIDTAGKADREIIHYDLLRW